MDNKYQLWLKQGNTRFWFPINPPSISLSNSSENETINIEDLGKTTILRSPNLLSFSFSSQFPETYFAQCNYKNLQKPFKSFNLIQNMKNTGIVRFTATSSPFDMECTIERFGLSEKSGDVGTLDFSIVLREYRKSSVKKINVVDNKATIPSPNKKARSDNRKKSKTYTVVKGDYLIKISKKKLGSTGRWKELYNLNKKVIGNNPSLIYPGQVLKLPT